MQWPICTLRTQRHATNSFPRGHPLQHEESIKLAPRDPEIPLPRAGWDSVDKGFVMTCTEEEANKLVEDSTMMATWVIEMLPIDMS
jgi:hypothetical protein